MVLAPDDAVGAVGVPVKEGLERGAFRASELVTLLENEESSPNAAASSFRVSKAAGAESSTLAIAVVTYSVVAILVELLLAPWVGATGFPVNTGSANMLAFDSFVTLPSPT